MKRRIILTMIFYLMLFSILSIFVCSSYGSMLGSKIYDSIPGPDLLSPTTDDIDLGGKDYLEFRWRKFGLVQTDYYDFRLYKGYNTTADNLISKQKFSTDIYPIKIQSSIFEVDQVYTWVLVQVFLSGQKSDRSFSSFKIIKK